MEQFLSSRLSSRAFAVLALHCNRNGIAFTKMSNNRLHVAVAKSADYFGLYMLEQYGINNL